MRRIKVRRESAITLSLLLGLSLVGLSLLLARPPVVKAATLTVTSDADAGGTCPGATCTLRQAIATAASGDTINFAADIATITLTSAELLINKNLTINGPGANMLSVQRSASAGNFRIFNITPNSVNATISGLTVANGNTPGIVLGGGILNLGTLTLTNSTISGNSAAGGGGGGISNSGGTLTLTNSTISGNSGGGGGGIINGGTMTIINSTISGNSAGGGGGGGMVNFATLTITNSTISGNGSGTGGGIKPECRHGQR